MSGKCNPISILRTSWYAFAPYFLTNPSPVDSDSEVSFLSKLELRGTLEKIHLRQIGIPDDEIQECINYRRIHYRRERKQLTDHELYLRYLLTDKFSYLHLMLKQEKRSQIRTSTASVCSVRSISFHISCRSSHVTNPVQKAGTL